MLRRLSVILFLFLTKLNYDIKSNSVNCENRDIKKIIENGMNVIGNYLTNLKRTMDGKIPVKGLNKNEFLDNLDLAFNDIQPPRKAVYNFNHHYPVNLLENKSNIYAVKVNAPALIRAHGYNYETHTVVTKDGYILKMHRIVNNVGNNPSRVAILHHGLLGSSDDWLLLSAKLCLPCLLFEHGFEVWLLNARGNKYSKKHKFLDVASTDYWDFSWHEMGIYDLTATIKHIQKTVKEADLYFIGHSMGTTALMVLLSSFPKYNKSFKSAILLAPLVYMKHVGGPLQYYANFLNRRRIISQIAEESGEFMVNKEFNAKLQRKYCKSVREVCSNNLLFIADGGKKISDAHKKRIFKHVPSGGSTKTVLHYLQLIKNGTFRNYNYGTLKNLMTYKRKYPPKYNLKSITLPLLIFSSATDWLSTVPDAKQLLELIPSVKGHYIVTEEGFDHLEFLWSKKALHLVYHPIIDILDTMTGRIRKSGLFERII